MAGEGVFSEFTPIVNSLGRLTSVLPGFGHKVTSDQAADVLAAKDTKAEIAHDRLSPLWKRLLTHGAAGALAGGVGLGAKAGLIAGGVAGHPWAGAATGAGVGAALGGGGAIANELFDHATASRRLELANRTIENANPKLLERLKHPDAKQPAEDYNLARSFPSRGLELGALLGGVGGGAIGAFTGSGGPGPRESRAASGALIGMGGLGAAGLLAGALWKQHRRQKLVDVLTKTSSIWLRDNDLKNKTETGGNPRKASNRQLMRANAGTPELYAAGRLTSVGKIAAEISAKSITKTFWKDADDGRKVYLVDGEQVRNLVSTGFIGGSNHEADSYVPEDEYWIEDTLQGMDRDAILLHEVTEAKHMREDDREYHDAHAIANRVEGEFRDEQQKKAALASNPLRKWFGYTKAAAEAPKLRSRSEVCIYSEKGILGIKKDGYLLMPGGGIDDGETPELAVAREAIEEADRKVLHLKAMGTSEVIWPEDVQQVKGFDGSRTYHFMALDGGKIGTKHEDNETFVWIDFEEAMKFIGECMQRDDQKSAKAQNEIRCQSIAEALTAVKAGHVTAVKLARIDIDIPAQLNDYSCGPACLAGLQAWSGVQTSSQAKLAADLETDSSKGTHPLKISQALGVAGREGWTADQVKTAVDAGHPVLMLCKDASADDHYVVAVGYDDHGVWVDDPAEPCDRMIYWPKLAEMWRSTEIEQLSQYGWEVTKIPHAENVKVADALNLVDRPEYVLFNHEGKIMVGNDTNKRFKLPTAGVGTPAPYEPTVRYTPVAGVPEAGAHGYNVRLNVGDAETAPEGFEGSWQDPHTVLRSLYGSMGLRVNAEHRELDRARARVILKAMKKRQPAPLASATPAPTAAIAS